MPSHREPGAPPPPRAEPPARRWSLSAAALGSGLAGALTLAFPVLEALSVTLGVAALTSAVGAWVRSAPGDALPRALACLGAVLGTAALVTAIGRVDKTIIDIDPHQLERRPAAAPRREQPRP